MTRWNDTKIRGEDTWELIRREWQAGETAQSLARRYDVGLANLWRRRAAGHWRRLKGFDPQAEPAEGWERHAEIRLDAFRLQRDEARSLAANLARAMTGEAIAEVPVWDVGFLLQWRAERLGAETAARDRAWAAGRGGWTQALWDENGWLRPLWEMDRLILTAQRKAWREDMGLPEGEAEMWP